MIKSDILNIKESYLILIYFSSLNFFFAYTYTVYSDQIKVFSVSLMLSHSSRALWILLCLKYSFTNLPPCFPNHPLILYYSNILHVSDVSFHDLETTCFNSYSLSHLWELAFFILKWWIALPTTLENDVNCVL